MKKLLSNNLKKLFLLAFIAFAINAHAQLNKKWSNSQSISGGIYRTSNCGLPISGFQFPSGGITYVFSNEFYESTQDSIKGVIRKIDSNSVVMWTNVLEPISVSDFALEDQDLAGIPQGLGYKGGSTDDEGLRIFYNDNISTSRLIRIDTLGNIVWNIVLTNINHVNDWVVDPLGNTYLVGRTPEQDSAGYKSNGIAIAKYDASGQQVWLRTRYISNFRTRPSYMAVDNSGNVYICGKKAAMLSAPPNYQNIFLNKFSPDGSEVLSRDISNVIDDNGTVAIAVDQNDDLLLGADVVTNNSINVKLRKLSGINGSISWTKTISNTELKYLWTIDAPSTVITTTTGMKCYDDAGHVLWSNGYIVETGIDEGWPVKWEVIAKNVDAAIPSDYYYVELDSTGTVTYKKNLSFGNHEEYMGDYASISKYFSPDWIPVFYLINDTTPPYGTRVTKLAQCSEFTYSFASSATKINVTNATCDNGQISVSWSGDFNSWPYVELWKGPTIISYWIHLIPPNALFQNLSAGEYTVKVFDESCGEQDTTVIIKCAPPTGLVTTDITRNKARLNWVLPTCTGGTQVQYRLQGAPTWTTVNTTANYKQLNGLTPNSIYEWHVAAKCGNTTPVVYSDFSAIQIFSTAAQNLVEVNSTAVDFEVSSLYPNESLSLYPNPATSQIIVRNNNQKILGTISIYDISGRMIYKKFVGSSYTTIDVKNFSKGVYCLRSDQMTLTIKFVKQ